MKIEAGGGLVFIIIISATFSSSPRSLYHFCHLIPIHFCPSSFRLGQCQRLNSGLIFVHMLDLLILYLYLEYYVLCLAFFESVLDRVSQWLSL